MKKLLIGLLALGSISAQASCFWDYANHNLDRKIQNGVLTLGANVVISQIAPSGVEKAFEILAESIALRSENDQGYAQSLKDGKFSRKIEKIFIEGKATRLEKLTEKLNSSGLNLAMEDIADAILSMDKAGLLCTKSRIMASHGSYIRFYTLKDITNALNVKFNQ